MKERFNKEKEKEKKKESGKQKVEYYRSKKDHGQKRSKNCLQIYFSSTETKILLSTKYNSAQLLENLKN